MRITIPATVDEAETSLNGLGQLLTAKEWERAAVVYAFTEPDQGSRQDLVENQTKWPIKTFARRGITGLKSPDAVRAYRKAWQSAIDDGQAIPVEPGDTVELPKMPWKQVFGESTPAVQERVARSFIRDNSDAIQRIVKDTPELGVEIARQVVATPATRVPVEHRLAAPIEAVAAKVRNPQAPHRDPETYVNDLRHGVNTLVPVLRAVQRGWWQPSPSEQLVLHALGLLLQQATAYGIEPQDDLFADIERYMAEASA